MTLEILKNKPLVEAIFEIRWYLEQANIDPNNQLLLGRLFDRINTEYPVYEQLPFAAIPEQMVEGLVRHRFRSENGWPLVQLGSGVLTLNDTENYIWKDFHRRVINVVNNLYVVHPNKQKFRTRNLTLKYIDAIDVNLNEAEVYEFLREKMKLNLSLNPALFEKSSVEQNPMQLDLQFAFKSNKPKGILNFRMAKGEKIDNQENTTKDVLIWETTIQSNESDLPEIPLNLGQWLEEAHSVAHDWFFTLVEGDLLRSFE